MAVEAARDACAAVSGKHRGAALCFHDLPVPRSPPFGHCRTGAGAPLTKSPPSTSAATQRAATSALIEARLERHGKRLSLAPRSAMPKPPAPSRCRAGMVRPPCAVGAGEPVAKLLGKACGPPTSSITSAQSTIGSTTSGRNVGSAMPATCRSCRR